MDPQIPGALDSAESAPGFPLKAISLKSLLCQGVGVSLGPPTPLPTHPTITEWTRDISIATQPQGRAGRQREWVGGALILVLFL